MDDLITWLRAQLDEDERVAQAAGGKEWQAVPIVYGPPDEGWGEPDNYEVHTTASEGWSTIVSHQTYEGGGADRVGAEHIARHDPARVLAEVEAKRRLLAGHEGIHRCAWGEHAGFPGFPCGMATTLALPYAGQDGFREEWRV